MYVHVLQVFECMCMYVQVLHVCACMCLFCFIGYALHVWEGLRCLVQLAKLSVWYPKVLGSNPTIPLSVQSVPIQCTYMQKSMHMQHFALACDAFTPNLVVSPHAVTWQGAATRQRILLTYKQNGKSTDRQPVPRHHDRAHNATCTYMQNTYT
jgi:hypothetical protein